MSSIMRISSLYNYPIKGCGEISLTTAELEQRGIKFDRNWMLIDENGKQITQRDVAKATLIKPALNGNGVMRLIAPGMTELLLTASLEGAEREVKVWDDQCLAVDQGDAAAEWFSTFLDRKCRLVMMEPDFVRRVDPKRLPDHVFSTTFTDGYQVLLASTASLRALNERLPEPVLMNRFRPNIVIGGAEPFEEDSWKRIKINAITMRVVKPCARCAVVSVNQEEATITKEPMHALAEFRNVDGKVLFGQYLAHESVGTISAGDEIRVLEKG